MIVMNDFRREYAAIAEEVDAAIKRVLLSGWYILGPEVEQFERAFSSFAGIPHTVGVANGLEALQIALMALEIGPGDEVITTSLSAVATTLAITSVGATPVFADVDEHGHLDPDDAERKITGKTKAIIPVHLYGQPCDVVRFQALCEQHNLLLIEDAAQAHGARLQDRPVGDFGVATGFSYYPTKNLGAYGDAGAVTTRDPAVAHKMAMLRNYGQEKRYHHVMVGINSRLDELHAAVLAVKLRYLPEWNERRRAIAARYTTQLQGIAGLTLPSERPDGRGVFHLYAVRTDKRDALQTHLRGHDIEAMIHYPTPIHKQACFPEYHTTSLPRTEAFCATVLSLPIHPFLQDEEVDAVAHQVRTFLT